MTEERITEYETPDGNTHTRTTIITDGEKSGGSSWMVFIVLLIAIAAGVWAFTQFNNSEAVKDTAIAEAAESVGTAASQVGDAAQDVADEVTNK